MLRIFIIIILFSICCPCQSLQISLNHEFSGAQNPLGQGPWLTATFINLTSNKVRLVMESVGLIDQEFIGSWYFNFAPTLNPSLLQFSFQSGVSANQISKGSNQFRADGDGYFDFRFNFATNAFRGGMSSIYDITYQSPIDSLSFNFTSVRLPSYSLSPFVSAAHVQGIGINACDSGWIANQNSSFVDPRLYNLNLEPIELVSVPEPSSFLLFAFLGVLFFGKNRQLF